MTEPKIGRAPRPRYDAAGIETIRRDWGPLCRTLIPENADTAMEQVIACLQAGLPAEVIDALLRIRFGSQRAWDEGRVAMEGLLRKCSKRRRRPAGQTGDLCLRGRRDRC
jgi:hypothetical protein